MKTNIPQRFEKMIWYVIAAIAVYNLLPLLVASLGLPILPLLPFVYICSNLVIAFVYGKNHNSDPLLPVCICVVFIPAIFMYFNTSAWVFLIVYFLISVLGMALGKVYGNRFKFK